MTAHVRVYFGLAGIDTVLFGFLNESFFSAIDLIPSAIA
jgi:hypothetical protein